jgi:hypothetical protein
MVTAWIIGVICLTVAWRVWLRIETSRAIRGQIQRNRADYERERSARGWE